jgi:hypothetical protein
MKGTGGMVTDAVAVAVDGLGVEAYSEGRGWLF